MRRLAEAGVVEQALHDVLAIVEGTAQRNVVDIGVEHRGHLPPLHLRGAPLGMQNEDVGRVATAKGLDGGRAGVAGGGADNGGAAAAAGKDVVHHPREELHRHVLERQRRAVEQLEHEMAGLELDQRRYRGMPEGGVGLVDDALQLGVWDVAVDKATDDIERHLGVGSVGIGRDLAGGDLWPVLRDIKAAIARKARENSV